MAINQKPYLAFEADLTPEQLAEIQALTKRWTEPTSQTRWNDGGEYTISDPGFYGGKLSDDKFSPSLNWIPNYIGTGSGENFSTEIDPSGAGYWGPISQPANISTWGRSDRTGIWDPNTGKWLGYQTESTGLRDFANWVGTMAAMYFGGQALAGAGGGGAAATGATSGATTAGAGGINWGAVGTAAAKNAAINAGLTLVQGGDMSDALRAGAIGAVSGGAGGVAAGYGVNPILAGAATGGGISALQGGDGRGILTGAATGALSGYGQMGITGNAIADRALVGAGNALIRGGSGRDAVTGAVTGALSSGAIGGGSGEDVLRNSVTGFASGDANSLPTGVASNTTAFNLPGDAGMNYFDNTFDTSLWSNNVFGDAFTNSGVDFSSVFDPSLFNFSDPSQTQEWWQNPNLQRAAIAAIMPIISNSIGGGGGGADLPQVNPAQLAQITQANNQNTWQQQLNASRVNSVTPEGSSTWSQTPQFNQGAYDQAMQAWQAAGNPNLPQPTREQFTTQQWTNTQTLNPQNQALRDAQRGFQQDAANALPGAAQRYLSGAAQGPNRSGIPDFQYTASTQQQGQLGANARPTYGQVSAPGSMSNPTFGNINRGGLTSSAQTTARDWASTVQGDVTDWNRQLAALDPWMFDQQGSDAMYNMSTRYMLPQQQAEKQALEARLGEQGFVPGTPAYETALKQILDSQSLAQADARDRALLAGREFGNQAFDNKAGALSSAVSGMLNFGDLGIRTDANAFNQNLSNAQLANAAQQQDFAQQLALSQQDFQEGLAANDVVKQLFGMNLDATNTNNRWAGQGFQDLLGLTQTNNAAIGANNNIALQLAQLNNAAVGQARNQANTDFNTDFNANRTAALDLYGAANQPIPQAPGALTSVVPGMNNADIAGMLQQYFGNNVDLQNASTAERNAIINALGQFLSAVVTGG